tara:strand:- start:6882 stop:7568 length:687 start_codon:yes stop_codon:yes gene_type:complete
MFQKFNKKTIESITLVADDTNSIVSTTGDFNVSIAGGTGIASTVDGGKIVFTPSDSSDSAKGIVQLASVDEVATGTSTVLATTPAGVKGDIDGHSDRVYDNTIKILPSDFMVNDDVADKPLHFKDGANSGVQISDAGSEMIAFVAIPKGKKATHVDVWANGNRTVNVHELEVDDTYDFTGTPAGTGACNTQIDITDVNSTATNFLAIIVVATATSQRTYGGLVTIANI